MASARSFVDTFEIILVSISASASCGQVASVFRPERAPAKKGML